MSTLGLQLLWGPLLAFIALPSSECFGGCALFYTATSQELLDCNHPKAHGFKEEW